MDHTIVRNLTNTFLLKRFSADFAQITRFYAPSSFVAITIFRLRAPSADACWWRWHSMLGNDFPNAFRVRIRIRCTTITPVNCLRNTSSGRKHFASGYCDNTPSHIPSELSSTFHFPLNAQFHTLKLNTILIFLQNFLIIHNRVFYYFQFHSN